MNSAFLLLGVVSAKEHTRLATLSPDSAILANGPTIEPGPGCKGAITQRLYNLYDNIFYMHYSAGTYEDGKGICQRGIPDTGSFRTVILTDQCIADDQGNQDPNCETLVENCLHPDQSSTWQLTNTTFEEVSYGQGTVMTARAHESINIAKSLTCPDGLTHEDFPILGVLKFDEGFNTLVSNKLCAIIGLGKIPEGQVNKNEGSPGTTKTTHIADSVADFLSGDDSVETTKPMSGTHPMIEEIELGLGDGDGENFDSSLVSMSDKQSMSITPSSPYASLAKRMGFHSFAFCMQQELGGGAWMRWGHEPRTTEDLDVADHALAARTISIIGKNHWAMMIYSVELVFPDQGENMKRSDDGKSMAEIFAMNVEDFPAQEDTQQEAMVVNSDGSVGDAYSSENDDFTPDDHIQPTEDQGGEDASAGDNYDDEAAAASSSSSPMDEAASKILGAASLAESEKPPRANLVQHKNKKQKSKSKLAHKHKKGKGHPRSNLDDDQVPVNQRLTDLHDDGTRTVVVSYDSIIGKNNGTMLGIVDTGTSLIGMPGFIAAQISQAIDHWLDVKDNWSKSCTEEDFPKLRINMMKTDDPDGPKEQLDFPPSVYLSRPPKEETTSMENDFLAALFGQAPEQTHQSCPVTMSLMSMETSTVKGPLILLGLPFFRTFLTTFDTHNRMIHVEPNPGNGKCSLDEIDPEAMAAANKMHTASGGTIHAVDTDTPSSLIMQHLASQDCEPVAAFGTSSSAWGEDDDTVGEDGSDASASAGDNEVTDPEADPYAGMQNFKHLHAQSIRVPAWAQVKMLELAL